MDNFSEQKYLSSKDAGAILGYTHDYISRLCRHGKMSGIQKGREWFVTQEELDAFKGRHELELQEKKKELSKKFSQIRLEAEAKKRKARENKTCTKPSFLSKASQVSSGEQQYNKRINFNLPKELAAAFVLALCLFIPATIQITKSTEGSYSFDQKKSKFYVKEFTNTVEQGIQDTIYIQSTVVEPVATIFASTQYLPEGYRQVFLSAGELYKETYYSLQAIGNTYLALYVLQGQAVYESIQNLDTMGAFVLRGYELVGESVYFGGKDILRTYVRILHLDSKLEISKNNLQKFTANISGGFDYAKQGVEQNIFQAGILKITSLAYLLQKNIGLNISSIESTASQVSGAIGAYVGSIFEFNLVKKEEKIKAIKLSK